MKVVVAMGLIVLLAVLWTKLVDFMPNWMVRNLLSVFVGRYAIGPIASRVSERADRWRRA